LIYHLSGAAEELLHAAAEGLALWRSQGGRNAARREPENDFEPGLGAFAALAGAGEVLDLLKSAFREERRRWSKQAAKDPAAKRMVELCDGLLAWLGESRERSTSGAPKTASQRRPRTSRPPRRSQHD